MAAIGDADKKNLCEVDHLYVGVILFECRVYCAGLRRTAIDGRFETTALLGRLNARILPFLTGGKFSLDALAWIAALAISYEDLCYDLCSYD